MAVTNSELPQKYPIFDFDSCSTENKESFYMNIVGIPPSKKRTITTKINFRNYDENDEEDKAKWNAGSDGDVGPFFLCHCR